MDPRPRDPRPAPGRSSRLALRPSAGAGATAHAGRDDEQGSTRTRLWAQPSNPAPPPPRPRWPWRLALALGAVICAVVALGVIVAPTETGASGLQDAGRGTAVGLWSSRALDYLVLTSLVGFLLAGGVLLGDGRLLRNGRPLGHTARRAARLAATAAAAWACVAVALFTFGLSSASARPLPEALDVESAVRFAGTRFGLALLVQGIAAALVALVAVAARTRMPLIAGLGVVAVSVVAIAWRGHAGTDEAPVLALAADSAHIAAASAWVGGLVALLTLLLARDALERLFPATDRFSRVASATVVVVGVTGGVNALLHMGSAGQLWTTSWGRLVLLKVVLFGGIAALGAANRSRVLPALRQGESQAVGAFRRMAVVEVGLMVAAFATAASLTSGIPADAEAAARIQSVSAAFGDGQINLTVDPAETGANVVHLYFLDAAGLQRPVEAPRLTLVRVPDPGQPAESVDVELLPAGPGHYTALGLVLTRPGLYQADLSASVEGEPTSTTAEITVR